METPNQKFYIVFYSDNGGREDCSVYYSWLTQATSKQAAIKKVIASEGLDQDDDLDAEAMTLIV